MSENCFEGRVVLKPGLTSSCVAASSVAFFRLEAEQSGWIEIVTVCLSVRVIELKRE